MTNKQQMANLFEVAKSTLGPEQYQAVIVAALREAVKPAQQRMARPSWNNPSGKAKKVRKTYAPSAHRLTILADVSMLGSAPTPAGFAPEETHRMRESALLAAIPGLKPNPLNVRTGDIFSLGPNSLHGAVGHPGAPRLTEKFDLMTANPFTWISLQAIPYGQPKGALSWEEVQKTLLGCGYNISHSNDGMWVCDDKGNPGRHTRRTTGGVGKSYHQVQAQQEEEAA